MHKCSFPIHQIKFVVNSRKNLRNCTIIWNHTAGSHNFRNISTWNNCGRLTVYTYFKSCRTPVNKLNSSLMSNFGNSLINITWDDIPSIHQRTSVIFAISWVTFCHHAGRVKNWTCDFSNRKFFMIGLFCREYWRVRWYHKMKSGIRNEVSLKWYQIKMKRAVKS